MTVLATLACVFFGVLNAWAAQSDWVRSPGGDVRIIAGKPRDDRTIPAILDIRLKPGWKTYWMDPGATGIPPQVTIDPKDGVAFSGLRFPAPTLFDDGTVRYAGYAAPVAFPLSLRRTGSGDVTLKASVFLGICHDICIPVQADFSVPLPQQLVDNPLDMARIDAANALLPQAPSNDFKVVSVGFDQAAKALHIVLATPRPPDKAPLELFLAGPPGYRFAPPQVMTEADGKTRATVPLHMPDTVGVLKTGSILLVVRAGGRSMQTLLAFD